MKYLIYLRVSTKYQDEEQQLDHALRFIKNIDHSSFNYEVYRDKATSKKPFFTKNRKGEVIIKREGAQQLLANLNKGDIIIALRLDRIVRSLYETNYLIDMLEDHKADILLVDQPGIKNKIMLGLYAGMAEEEIKLLRKRITEKLESKKIRGERYSYHLPYGYKMHETHMIPIRKDNETIYKPGVLIEVPEEQEVMSRMSQYFDMGMSYQNIANTLTDQGYRNREGNPFQKMSIYRILSRIKQTKSEGQPLEEKESAMSLA